MSQKDSPSSSASVKRESEAKKHSIRTFNLDDTLPSLPLPDIDSTLDKYLESVRPFTDEIDYLKTKKIVDNFRYGIGKKLQFVLSEKAKRERNWVRLNEILYQGV